MYYMQIYDNNFCNDLATSVMACINLSSAMCAWFIRLEPLHLYSTWEVTQFPKFHWVLCHGAPQGVVCSWEVDKFRYISAEGMAEVCWDADELSPFFGHSFLVSCSIFVEVFWRKDDSTLCCLWMRSYLWICVSHVKSLFVKLCKGGWWSS